jgi:hypothetical protein
MKRKSKGWRHESIRHSLARKGIKSGRKTKHIYISTQYTGNKKLAGIWVNPKKYDVSIPKNAIYENIETRKAIERKFPKLKNKDNWTWTDKKPHTLNLSKRYGMKVEYL